MWSVFESPRRRRRLTFAAVAVGVALPLIILGVHFSNPGSQEAANGPTVNEPLLNEPKQVPFTAEKKRAVRTVLAQFISTAVARKDVGSSWDISGPSLRSGFTRDE